MFLGELTGSVQEFKGIGPATMGSLANLGVLTISDLLSHFPRDYEDRSAPRSLREAMNGEPANTVVQVTGQEFFGFGRKKTLKILIEDESAQASLICFGRNFLAQKLIPGKQFRLYGIFQYRYGELQSSSFEVEEYPGNSGNFGRILPVYPLSGKLTQQSMRKLLAKAVSRYSDALEDEIPLALMEKHQLLHKNRAVRQVHFPDSMQTLEQARKTLIYEEIFHLQFLVARRGYWRRSARKSASAARTELQDSLIRRLPFTLTHDQEKVLEEMRRDFASPTPMARLLQGDVGSGKTLVAFLAALPYMEAGRQVAFLAPTELLARQHAENAARILQPLGIRLAFFSGNVKDKQRGHLLSALENGDIDLIIGTHALFSRDVTFRNLGFIIVDEQQRFGVLQRLAIMEKGEIPDLLLMTATPIPRTLALTAFGDLDVSYIRTMPAGRKPIITHLAREGNEGKVYDWIRKEIRQGHQAYFVYPLIEQSEKIALKDAESMYQRLQEEIFPDFRLGLIHSRVPEEDKREVMHSFQAGETDILVATSVIEVGVDVPNVTCIVIEHAERFGLSALHQLRGRVGRGEAQSYAFLIYSENLTEDGKQRLRVMKEESDGFRIAEEDMSIRGPGELTGIRQSGYLRLDIADLSRDIDTLLKAREDAYLIVEKDPGLLNPEHRALREVLEKAPPFPDDFLQIG